MLRGIWIFLDRDGEIFHEFFFFFSVTIERCCKVMNISN